MTRHALLAALVLTLLAGHLAAHQIAPPADMPPLEDLAARPLVFALAPGIHYEPNPATGSAVWVSETLTAKTIDGAARRPDNFKADPNVAPAARAKDDDYRGSGYDRGHLAAAANYGDQATRNATFNLANVAPQLPAVNQGPIKWLEESLRQKATAGRRVLIVTAPVYELGRPPRLAGRLPVPSAFIKAALIFAGDDQAPAEALAYRVENTTAATIRLITIDQAEAAIGRDLFSFLPDDLETRLEAAPDP